MNVITIAGQLGRDAEVRFLPNGDAVAGFSIADSMGRDKPTIWWNCSLFGKRGESLAQYLTKGASVTVTGTVTERDYVNKDGQKVKAQDIRVNDVALQGGKREGGEAPAKPAATPRGQRDKAAFPDPDFDPSDVPF